LPIDRVRAPDEGFQVGTPTFQFVTEALSKRTDHATAGYQGTGPPFALWVLMLWAVLSALIAAALAPWIARCRNACGWIFAAVPAVLTVYLAAAAPAIADDEILRVEVPWLPELGVTFSLLLDGLSLLFAILITGIGSVVFVYAGGYLGGH
jgi:formate hydrogenlyase subunit 3/multisubunit Na+/H+ antiporter MnhD subunit